MDNLVSVIIPIYNKEKTLKKSIKSILNQTYKNLEIILINDGSTDGSYDICEKLLKEDDRIVVIHTNNNGVSVARNLGIKISRGTYLSFIDPDDEVSPVFVEKLLEISLEKKCDISSCCAMVFNERIQLKNSFFKESNAYIPKKRAIAQLYSNRHYRDAGKFIDVGVPWGKIYKKEFLLINKIHFEPKLRRMQDSVFNLNAFNQANKIYYVDTPLYYYNIDNFKKIKYSYIDDADKLFYNVAKKMSEFNSKWFDNDLLMKELLNHKIFSLYLIVLRNKICHPKLKASIKERTELVKAISLLSPFRESIKFLNYKILNYDSYLVTTFSLINLLLLKRKGYKFIIYLYSIIFKII